MIWQVGDPGTGAAIVAVMVRGVAPARPAAVAMLALVCSLVTAASGCCGRAVCVPPRAPVGEPGARATRVEARRRPAGAVRRLSVREAARAVCRSPLDSLAQAFDRNMTSKPGVMKAVVADVMEYRRQYGPCLRVKMEGKNRVRLIHGKMSVVSRVYLGPGGRISGLWFDLVVPNQDSLAAVAAALRALGGRGDGAGGRGGRNAGGDVAITVRQAGSGRGTGGVVLLRVNADRPLAVASSFKLSVLKTVVAEIKAGRLRWSDVVALRPGSHQRPHFPVGFMPPGTHVTVESLATFMIALSDNAATDQLIARLGRRAVERHVPKRNVPLATTTEMSKLKHSTLDALARQYIRAHAVSARRQILARLAATAWPGDMGHDRGPGARRPRHIRELEWFYTTDELCGLILELRQTRLFDTVRRLKNRDRTWDRYAFKGGSEPGVVNLTYALRHRKSERWYCISATWNNPHRRVAGGKLKALVRRLMRLLAGRDQR